ncbi:MAG: SMC-Scp complex subunit ScpB, partial [Ignavibacteriaceae bacterium]
MDNIYNSVIEALIFASEDSISASELIKAIKGIDGEEIQISSSDIENCVEELNAKYETENLSVKIIKISNGFLFATKPEYAKYVG